MILKKISELCAVFTNQSYSLKKLALSMSLGIYIAFCPFVGFHTALAFFFGWAFSLYIPILLAISMLINNPWTMIPVYFLDHLFGLWVLDLFSLSHDSWTPDWLESVNMFLTTELGFSGFSLSAFMIGGNILGICFALLSYPMIKYIIIYYRHKRSSSEYNYENNCTK